MANTTARNIQGAHCNKDLRVLEPILKKWITVVSEYSAAFGKDDACWWYTERANVGILAAATWKTKDWLALEEYSTTKRGEIKGETKNGRCDLYIGKKNHRSSFALEAKRCYQGIGGSARDDMAKVFASIKVARDDAGNIENDEANKRLACCFIMPFIRTTKAPSEIDLNNKLTAWLGKLKKEIPWDAIAWNFPKESRVLQNSNGYYLPGVVLVISQKQRANRQKTV